MFSDNLKQMLSARGVTQKWLADETRTSEATISRYINGIHKPNTKLIVRIARALDVSVDHLLGACAPTEDSHVLEERDILASCYSKATEKEKRLLWGILEDYLSDKEKIIVIRFFPM